MLAVFSLVYAATDTAFCKVLISPGLAESFLQRMRTLVPGHLSSHSALSSYGLFAPLTYWRLSVSLQPLVQALESFQVCGAPWFSTMLPCFVRGRVTTTITPTILGKIRFTERFFCNVFLQLNLFAFITRQKKVCVLSLE